MSASFLDLPYELRLKIYEELFTASEPIEFKAIDWDRPFWPPLFVSKKYGLCPALLRVCKVIHREASPVLFSQNCFSLLEQTPFFRPTPRLMKNGGPLRYFCDKICGRRRTRLLRHICIDFPSFYHELDRNRQATTVKLFGHGIELLQHIENKCKGLTRLAMVLLGTKPNYITDSGFRLRALELVDAYLKRIPSLDEVIVDVRLPEGKEMDNDFKGMMQDLGWIVKFTSYTAPRLSVNWYH